LKEVFAGEASTDDLEDGEALAGEALAGEALAVTGLPGDLGVPGTELFFTGVFIGDEDGDLEVDVAFLDGLGEFEGLIELNNSLALLLANRLCFCIFIKVLKSRTSPGSFLGLSILGCRGVIKDEETSFEVASSDFETLLTVVKPLLEDELGAAAAIGELGPHPLELDPHDEPKKSLPALGSHNFGTIGALDGLGATFLGEALLKMSVG
jgi:hypothetical protein